jgi:glycosyltransferase involved in cell wall biosynthesis
MTPRIALVASDTADEPGALLTARLRHLRESGWDARLFCKGERWRDDPALRDPALRKHIVLAPRAQVDSSPFDRRLRRLRPVLVHFHSGWAAWKGMRAGRLPKCRVIVSLRADGQDLAVPEPEKLWERADRLVFPHRIALDRAAAQGWPRDRSVVVHPPVSKLEAASARGAHAGALQILSAGSLVWEQGFEHSVHAVRLLLDAGVACEYRILGEGGDHVQAVAFARHQLGLADHVHLNSPNGSHPLWEGGWTADVFVDPAVTDTTSPTWLAAAQSGGLPFVATARRAGLPKGGGIAVPRRNPRAIADGLARLAADPDLRRRMGRAGRQSQSILTLDDHLAELQRLYRDTLAATG